MQRVREQVGLFFGGDFRGGEGVTIAVLDTGIGYHADLAGKLLDFGDFVAGRRLAYDDNGHGTHVCGILCGSGALSDGRYRGMAPGARIVVGKVLDEKGGGSVEGMLAGLDWILRERERYRIRILNISVGIGSLEAAEKEEALKEKLARLWESGILVVCAAGNKGPGEGTISGLGDSASVLTVGCHDGVFFQNRPGRCETYCGWGRQSDSPEKPDLVAPGTDIISCNVNCYRQGGRFRNAYIAKSGTSMATPIVAGAAALALQRWPDLTNERCRQKLQFTATDLGLPWNRQGWGLLNVKRLLE
ncbi:MAG: S8 family peptidase [Roseburia sp.]|nr:S8 family peptidase [Roseburia sp.]MCM1097230.1 S8 family peptidase [Ruminococcus flavefaciens]